MCTMPVPVAGSGFARCVGDSAVGRDEGAAGEIAAPPDAGIHHGDSDARAAVDIPGRVRLHLGKMPLVGVESVVGVGFSALGRSFQGMSFDIIQMHQVVQFHRDDIFLLSQCVHDFDWRFVGGDRNLIPVIEEMTGAGRFG